MKPEAIALLERVKQLILEEPKRIAMGKWLQDKDNILYCAEWSSTFEEEEVPKPRRGYPACGTVGCIAGWVLYEHYGVKEIARRLIGSTAYYEDMAAEVLGLNQDEADELFTDDVLVHAKNQQTRAHALAVAAHIDKFIAAHKEDA